MRKLISFVLALVMLCSLAIVMPASATEIDRETVTENLEMLQVLGIVQEEYHENNISVEQKVTRAEFAIYFHKLLNLSEQNSGTLYYNDVPRNHYAFDAITALTEQGYISGVEEKTFSPDEVMEKEHAAMAFIKALGYDIYADPVVNNPQKAYRDTEILNGVSNATELLLGDLILLMKNALLANCLEISGIITSKGMNYKKGKTLLYYTRGMDYVFNGRVTGVDGTSIDGKNMDANKMMIGEKLYLFTVKNGIDYLGYNVNFIFQDKTGDLNDTIIWMEKNTATTKALEINVDEYANYNKANSVLTYYGDGDSSRSVTISQSISLVYNGAFVARDISEIFSKPRYTLTLFDLSGDSGYELAVVWAYENRLVTSVDKENLMLYDKLTQTPLSLNSNDYQHMEIVNAAGEAVKPESIPLKSVASTYLSKDKQYLKIVISTETVSGAYNGSDGKSKIMVNNKPYFFYDASFVYDYKGVKKLTLYLDCKGYIAHAETSFANDNMFVGYAYKGRIDKGAFDGDLHFMVLNENGEIQEIVIQDQVVVDGKRYKNMQEAYDKIAKDGAGNMKPQIMCFTKNAEGKVTAIDIADDNGGSGKVIMKNQEIPSGGSYLMHFKDTMNIIGMQMLINGDTKVFYVPTDAEVATARENDFQIKVPEDAEDFAGAVSYKITADEVFYEQYIIRKGAMTATAFVDKEGIFLVEDVIETMDEDGFPIQALVGMQQGKRLTLKIDPDLFDPNKDPKLQNIKSGDVLRVAHKNNVLGRAEMKYSYGSSTSLAENRDDPVHNARFVSGHVYSKNGNVFKLDFDNDGKWDQIADMTDYAANIMVYDSQARGEKVRKGTVDDMKTIVDAGTGSFVVMHTYYMRCWGLVIYK